MNCENTIKLLSNTILHFKKTQDIYHPGTDVGIERKAEMTSLIKPEALASSATVMIVFSC